MSEEVQKDEAYEVLVDQTPPDIAAEVAAGRWNPTLIRDEDYDRRKYIGSSNAAAIMGLAPEINGRRDTALTVWNAKVGVSEELDAATRLFLERRKRWEPVVVAMLHEEFDAEIVATNLRYVDPYLPFVAAELDFEWLDPQTGLVEPGEVKTVSPFAFKEKFGWGDPGTEEVPVHYYTQVQHGMMVRGGRRSIVAAMVGLDSMVFYPIARNEDAISDMRRAYLKFWNGNVLQKIPPDPMSMGDLKALYRTSNGLSVRAEDDVGSKALRLRGLKAQVDAWELEAVALEFDIKLAMKDAEKLLVDGRSVFSWKEQNWSRLDQEALKAEQKEIYRKFLKSGKHRVFKPMYGN